MRELNIALGVIEQGDHYILQLRNGDPKIGAVGLIGCYGGKIETDEAAIDAVCRELSEETNLRPQSHEVRFLDIIHVISDRDNESVKIHAHVFHVPIEEDTVIETREGELVMMNYSEVMSSLDKMTPGTRACFERLIEKVKE